MRWLLDLLSSFLIGKKHANTVLEESVQPIENKRVYMISMKELLDNKNLSDLPEDHQDNLNDLLEKANAIREAWGKPMKVTSGYRSMEDHLRIYKEKGITDESLIPMKSKHLYGQAVDIYDPELKLTEWLKSDGAELAEKNGLYFEEGNKNWVHMQTVSPKSGNRWFKP